MTGAVASMTVLAACATVGGGGTTAATKTTTLRCATSAAQSDVQGQAMAAFGAQVQSQSHGAIVAKNYYNGELGSNTSLDTQLKNDAIQCAWVGPDSVFESSMPDLNVLYLPFLYSSPQQVYTVTDGPIGQSIDAAFLKTTGFRILGWAETGFKNYVTKEPVPTFADFKGLKLRTVNSPVNIKQVQAWGAVAVPMDYTDVDTSLQQGVISGADSPDPDTLSTKLYQLAPYVNEWDFTWEYIPVVVNNTWYTSLSPQLQKIVQAAATSAVQMDRHSDATDEQSTLTALKAAGAKIVPISPAQRALARKADEPVYTWLRSTLSAQGKQWMDEILKSTGA
jgi:tripartite ATP-independent transporter DctP family solute receptor